MGCFFVCFRSRDRNRKRRNVYANPTTSPPRCRESPTLKNKVVAVGLRNPALDNQTPTSHLSKVLSDQNKSNNLHRRTGTNLRWTQQLVTPAEVPVVQSPNCYTTIAEDLQKDPVSSEKDPLQEMDELASELAELTRTIGKEVEDFEKLGAEVEYLKNRKTMKRSSVYKTEMVSVTDPNLDHSAYGVKRVVSSKQSVSMCTEGSVISDVEYSIEHTTKPVTSQIKVSDTEQTPSKLQHSVADSSKLSVRSMSSTQSGGKMVRFDLETEAPSASFDSANTISDDSNCDSISSHSISQNSYTVYEENEEESVLSEKSQSYSSYTGSESTVSDVSHSEQSVELGSQDESISRSTVSSRVISNEDEAEELSSNASKIHVPGLKRSSRYQNYESTSDEEEYDSSSDTEDSFASIHSDARYENQDVSEACNQLPALQKSNYSPQPLLSTTIDNNQSTWTNCAKTLENASANNNARIRTQYIYPVLNPVENLSQWRALKKDSKADAFGNTKEFYETSKSWVEHFEMTESQSKGDKYPKSSPTKKQRVADSLIQASTFATKENIVEFREEPNQKRKLIPFSAEPVFKEPKALASQHIGSSKSVTGDAKHVDGVCVDMSLSQWLKPTEATVNEDRDFSLQKNNKGKISTKEDVLQTEVNKCWNNFQSQNQEATMMDNSLASRSVSPTKVDCRSIMGLSELQNPHGTMSTRASPLRSPSKNNDERPILGALTIEHLQAAAANQISPRRSPSSKDLDDRPIIGSFATNWNNKKPVSPSKWEDRKKGTSNSTNKYKEERKVSCDSTPFEPRVERALSNRMEYKRHAKNISS